MSLSMVLLSEEVWLTCAAHALTTKSEEIMGLLFGDVKDLGGTNKTALIWGASPQVRSVRLKDRVETSPELQIEATAHADRMAETLGVKTRVIGWYHSHPGHTIHPSHVDVQTQGQYQKMDSDFIGLIFSCFSEDAQKVQNMQVIAFQSLDGRQMHVPPVDINSVVELDSSSSDNALSTSAFKFEHDTADSRASKGKQRMNGQPLGQHNVNTLHSTIPDADSSDMSDSLQEALRRSRMDVSAAEYVKKEVRFQVLPSKDVLRLGTPQDLPTRQKLATSKMRATPLACVADLQDVLFEEERLSFQNALGQNTRDGKIHPLTYIHHTSTYQASLCKLMEVCVSPMINALDDQLGDNISRAIKLTEETKSLELKIREKEASRRQKSRVFPGGDVVMEQADVQAPTGSVDVRSPCGKEAGVSRHNMQIN